MHAAVIGSVLPVAVPSQGDGRTDNPAELRWSSRTHVRQVDPTATSLTCRFTVTNTAKYSVFITTLHSSCACLTTRMPPLPEKPCVLVPGATATLEVTLNLTARDGEVEKTIVVESSLGFDTLRVKAIRAKVPGT